MKLGIMQPYLFPYIGYFQLMNYVDYYVVYDDVNFIKGGWINRNRILINGKDSYLTISLKDASPFKKINEIEIINDEKSKRKILNSLMLAYKKAPYFNDVYPIFEDILNNKEQNLAKFIFYSFKQIAKYLDINTKLVLSSSLEKDNDLKGKDKVIHICKNLGAQTYINAIGGQELYDKKEFKDNNIDLKFLKTGNISYKQFNNEFVANLSIIDVLMFNSKKQVKELLENFTLI